MEHSWYKTIDISGHPGRSAESPLIPPVRLISGLFDNLSASRTAPGLSVRCGILGIVLTTSEMAEVENIIRDVARTEILPRFGRLSAADISEKAPGDLVTVADRAAEAALTRRLTGLLPGSLVVGEEAVAGNPDLLKNLAGPEPVWIIDPIDGTHNYATDNPRFTTLVTLAQNGRLLASWTYAPILGTIATAVTGGGAFIDGQQVRVAPAEPGLRNLDVVIPQPKWWTPDLRRRFNALSAHAVALTYLDAAGLEYLQLVGGKRSALVLTWENPWDHAAGLLLLAEAGGASVTLDGTPFKIAGGNALPFVAAVDARCAAELCAALIIGDDTMTALTSE